MPRAGSKILNTKYKYPQNRWQMNQVIIYFLHLELVRTKYKSFDNHHSALAGSAPLVPASGAASNQKNLCVWLLINLRKCAIPAIEQRRSRLMCWKVLNFQHKITHGLVNLWWYRREARGRRRPSESRPWPSPRWWHISAAPQSDPAVAHTWCSDNN